MNELVGFKFRAVNDYLVDSLRNNYIYFSTPNQLNDPFDCQVDIAAALDAAIARSDGELRQTIQQIRQAQPLFDQIQRDIQEFGVFSIAGQLYHSVMCSHYADEHRGVCLTYSFPEDFTIGLENNIIGRAPIAYGDDPITDWIVQNAPTIDFSDPRDFAIGLMQKLLTVKADGWSYEEEYRLIRTESGILEHPQEYLTQVCFGPRTTEEDQARVEDALQQANSEATRLRMTRSEANFGLVAVEI